MPRFAGFHGEPPVALRFGSIGPGVDTGIVVTFEKRRIRPTHALGAGNVEADALFGFVVVADGTQQVASQAPVLAKGEDAVLVFLRVGPVIADAQPAVGGLGNNIFREAQVVSEEAQAVASRGILVVLDTPADAFFGQQPGDEGVVAFTVLHAVAAWPGIGEKAGNFFAPLPGGNVGVVGKNGFDDLHDGLFLKDTVMPAAPEEPDPGNDGEAVAGETTVGTELLGGANEPRAAGLAAVREAAVQPHGAPEELLEFKMGISRKEINAQLEPGR